MESVVGNFLREKREKVRELNKNVKLVLGFNGFNSLSSSLCQRFLLAPFLYDLSGGSNSFIGVITSFEGITQFLLAIPSGYLGDIYRRDSLLKLSGVIGFIAVFVGLFCFTFVQPLPECDEESEGIQENKTCVSPLVECFEGICTLIPIMFLLQGAFTGLMNPPMESIFADSVVTGERTFIFTFKYSIVMACQSIGPLIGMIMFLALGDEWNLSTLRLILTVGILIKLIPIALSFSFSDENSLGEVSEGGVWTEKEGEERERERDDEREERGGEEKEREDEGREERGERKGEKKRKKEEEEEEGEEEGEEEEEEFLERDGLLEGEEGREKRERKEREIEKSPYLYGFLGWFHPQSRHFIPLMLSLSDLIFAFGAGITIRFFPLYFQKVLKMSPAAVTLVYFLNQVVTIFVANLAAPLAVSLGRMPATILMTVIAIFFLIGMTYTENPFLASTLYILRTALIRAPEPFIRSVLMDAVRKEDRSKWNSVESISFFSWSGSSIVGGFLVDANGYGTTILVTCAFYFVAVIPLLPLWELDAEKKNRFQNVDEGEVGETDSGEEKEREESGERREGIEIELQEFD